MSIDLNNEEITISNIKKTDIGEKLEQLAERLVNEALANNAEPEKNLGFTARLDVFRAISTYHLGLKKLKKKPGDDDDEDVNFNDVKARLRAVGGAK